MCDGGLNAGVRLLPLAVPVLPSTLWNMSPAVLSNPQVAALRLVHRLALPPGGHVESISLVRAVTARTIIAALPSTASSAYWSTGRNPPEVTFTLVPSSTVMVSPNLASRFVGAGVGSPWWVLPARVLSARTGPPYPLLVPNGSAHQVGRVPAAISTPRIASTRRGDILSCSADSHRRPLVRSRPNWTS